MAGIDADESTGKGLIMALLAGTDEAGYGPNLGPLTIGGTVWRCSETDTDLYRTLKKVVSKKAIPKKIQIADSKTVYSATNGLENLERNVLALVQIVHGRLPESFDDLAGMLGFAVSLEEASRPFQHPELALPIASDPIEIGRLAEQAATEMQRQKVELVAVHVCAIFPDEFNSGIERYGNKASFLSAMTMKCVRHLMKFECDAGEDCLIGCDKHGGRGHYAGLINQFLTDQLVQVIQEGRSNSRYQWTEGDRRRDISFSVGGESFVPTALASMAAKYVRQLAMTAWNQFWCTRIPELQPTQGYPMDAKRFRDQIRTELERIELPEREYWRCR